MKDLRSIQLKDLTDTDLLTQARVVVKREREATTDVLVYIIEIEDRKLFAKNHSCLFDWVVKDLGYSEGQAYRRIEAARLMRELPETSETICSGNLNLSQIAIVQSYFRRERLAGNPLPIAEKRNTINEIKGKSTRETQELLFKRMGIAKQNVIHLYPSDEQLKQFEHIKSLWSHKLPGASWVEIFAALAAQAIQREDLSVRPLPKSSKSQHSTFDARKNKSRAEQTSSVGRTNEHHSNKTNKSRHIPIRLRKEIWKRDDGQCTYRNSDGERCKSKMALQIDHIHPFAKGGESKSDNLRLLCSSHNRYLAYLEFGRRKIEEEIRKRLGEVTHKNIIAALQPN